MENIGLKELADYKVYMMTSGYSDRTIETYMVYLKGFFKYLQEKSIEKLSEVTPETVTQFHIYLASVKFRDRRLSLSTQNHKIIGIIMFFRFLVREKMFCINLQLS